VNDIYSKPEAFWENEKLVKKVGLQSEGRIYILCVFVCDMKSRNTPLGRTQKIKKVWNTHRNNGRRL
jgi:hypothetical protein